MASRAKAGLGDSPAFCFYQFFRKAIYGRKPFQKRQTPFYLFQALFLVFLPLFERNIRLVKHLSAYGAVLSVRPRKARAAKSAIKKFVWFHIRSMRKALKEYTGIFSRAFLGVGKRTGDG